MLRLLAASLGGVLLSLCLILGLAPIDAADKKADVPTTEEIMKIVNKPKGGLHRTVGMALEEDSINWDNVSKMSKQYAELADALGKNPCPKKGTLESWTKLCKVYAEDAKALETAVGKKDKDASVTAWSKLNRSCTACHDEHRGEP
jgi:cytochrome c556